MIKLDKQRCEILKDNHRFKVIVAGRRYGKTYLALTWLLQGKLNAGERRWFIAPTYKQGKMIAFPILRQILRGHPLAHLKETELSVTFDNGAEVCIKGADNEDNLRGAGLNRVVLDEYAIMKPQVWEEIILPMLATSEGRAMFIGSPDGHNHFYDLYMKGQGGDELWKSWLFTTEEGGFVSVEEIERAKANMDARLFRQEFQATFETAGTRAVYNFDRSIHIKEGTPSSDIFAGCDFNVDNMSVSIMCRYTDGVVHVFDEIHLKNSNTMEMAQELRKKYPSIRIYPDASGSARSTTSNRSDHDILRNFGFKVISPKANPSHIDRLNAFNSKLLNSNGKVGMTVSSKCTHLIRDMELVQRDKKGGIDKSDMTLTHALDSASYPISYLFPVRDAVQTTLMA